MKIDKRKMYMFMTKHGLTNKELAKRAGIGKATVDRMKKGGEVWPSTLARVTMAFNIEAKELLK